jgi:hypothetical protein
MPTSLYDVIPDVFPSAYGRISLSAIPHNRIYCRNIISHINFQTIKEAQLYTIALAKYLQHPWIVRNSSIDLYMFILSHTFTFLFNNHYGSNYILLTIHFNDGICYFVYFIGTATARGSGSDCAS